MNLIATQWPRRLQTVDFIQITKQNSILQDRIPARECNHGRNESCMHSKLRTRKRGGEVGRAGKHSEHGRGTGSLNTETVNPFITWASRPNYLLLPSCWQPRCYATSNGVPPCRPVLTTESRQSRTGTDAFYSAPASSRHGGDGESGCLDTAGCWWRTTPKPCTHHHCLGHAAAQWQG